MRLATIFGPHPEATSIRVPRARAIVRLALALLLCLQAALLVLLAVREPGTLHYAIRVGDPFALFWVVTAITTPLTFYCLLTRGQPRR